MVLPGGKRIQSPERPSSSAITCALSIGSARPESGCRPHRWLHAKENSFTYRCPALRFWIFVSLPTASAT